MNGIINILKPSGISSSDVVYRVKRILNEKRVGHTGTLDPGAAGVLPICVGRATKLSDYIMKGDKEYIAEICFGAQTDTLDSYGVVQNVLDVNITKEMLCSVINEFIGEQMQAPPAYSAVKHEGRPLYKLARKGVIVEKPARKVFINYIELLFEEENRFLLKIGCSKGTYIRTLLEDIGKRLEAPAYTSFLLRTKSGAFLIEDAITLEEAESITDESQLILMSQALKDLPKIHIKDYLYPIVMSGAGIDLDKANIRVEEDTEYAIFYKEELIGIAMKIENELKIVSRIKI